MHCAADECEWTARQYTEKGLLALRDGLPKLQALGVHEMEMTEGFLTPLAQSAWRQLRPNIKFEDDFSYFAFDSLVE